MYFDRFDVCEAFYMFSVLYHGGQFTKEYAILGRLDRLGFSPRPSISVETMEENARELFDRLVERAGFEPYESDESDEG